MRYPGAHGLACLLAIPLSGRAAQAAEAPPPPVRDRNPRWAVPVELPGTPNLFRVSTDLYRGGQPTAEGFRKLAELGVKTVVNLRAFHSDEEILRGLRLVHERIRFATWHPEKEDVVAFLRIVRDPERVPVLVHCRLGADRTGMMVAVYRVCVEGWSNREAIEEMKQGGFGFSPLWSNMVRYVEELDVERCTGGAQRPQ